MTEYIFYLAIAAFVSMILGAVLAWIKNRHVDRWAFACFFILPLFILIFLPRDKTNWRQKNLSRNELEQLREEFMD